MGDVVSIDSGEYVAKCNNCDSIYFVLVTDDVGPDCRITHAECAECGNLINIGQENG